MLFIARECFPLEVNFFRYVFETIHKTPTPLKFSQDVTTKKYEKENPLLKNFVGLFRGI